jgi:protein gp37
MSEATIIAWTDHTFNPWMGCNKVSAGCANCYAETLTTNRMGLRLWGPEKTTRRQITKSPWQNVVRWNKAAAKDGVIRKVFVGSLMDWAEDHKTAARARPALWELIKASTSLDFQMLTKRPERIRECLPEDWGTGYENVWLGTSIEDMRVAERADHLRDIPAAIRFVSYEPALGPLNDLELDGIDWVIYGGESGPGHRPEDKQWARDMHAKCNAAGAAFFHKQSAGHRTELGIELDGVLVREYPKSRAPVTKPKRAKRKTSKQLELGIS